MATNQNGAAKAARITRRIRVTHSQVKLDQRVRGGRKRRQQLARQFYNAASGVPTLPPLFGVELRRRGESKLVYVESRGFCRRWVDGWNSGERRKSDATGWRAYLVAIRYSVESCAIGTLRIAKAGKRGAA